VPVVKWEEDLELGLKAMKGAEVCCRPAMVFPEAEVYGGTGLIGNPAVAIASSIARGRNRAGCQVHPNRPAHAPGRGSEVESRVTPLHARAEIPSTDAKIMAPAGGGGRLLLVPIASVGEK